MYLFITIPVQFICSFRHTSIINFQLIYWGTYTQIYPKIKLPVYLHASFLSNHKDLPVTTTTCVHDHRSTRSLPYLFILIISFRQTICTYLPLACCSKYSEIYLFINQPFSLCFSPGFTCTLICQLICWSAYRQTHRENECTWQFWCSLIYKLTCPLTDPSIYPPIMFILILSSRLTTKIYLYTHLLV